jgi:hypothetical protein
VPFRRLSLQENLVRSKPSWTLFVLWLVAYTLLDLLLTALLHTGLAWNQVPGALGGAAFGAAVTWLFAYRRWLNS